MYVQPTAKNSSKTNTAARNVLFLFKVPLSAPPAPARFSQRHEPVSYKDRNRRHTSKPKDL